MDINLKVENLDAKSSTISQLGFKDAFRKIKVGQGTIPTDEDIRVIIKQEDHYSYALNLRTFGVTRHCSGEVVYPVTVSRINLQVEIVE